MKRGTINILRGKVRSEIARHRRAKNKAASERCKRSFLSRISRCVNSRRRIRVAQASQLAPEKRENVIPRSGGADLWKHRALNRGRRSGDEERERENKKKGGGGIVERETEVRGERGCAIRKSSDKRDEARRRALSGGAERTEV